MPSPNKPKCTTTCPENAKTGPLEAVAAFRDGEGRGGLIGFASTTDALFLRVYRTHPGVKVLIVAESFDLDATVYQAVKQMGAGAVSAALAKAVARVGRESGDRTDRVPATVGGTDPRGVSP